MRNHGGVRKSGGRGSQEAEEIVFPANEQRAFGPERADHNPRTALLQSSVWAACIKARRSQGVGSLTVSTASMLVTMSSPPLTILGKCSLVKTTSHICGQGVRVKL